MTRRAKILFLLWFIAVLVLLWYFARVAAYGQPVPLMQRTNWYYFAATAIDASGLESEYSNEAKTNRYWGNLWRKVTLAWDYSDDFEVIGHLIYWGTNSHCYSNHSDLFLGLAGTVQVFPPPLTNRVVVVTSAKATNLLACDRVSGPWVLLGKTNVSVTNPHTPQYWRAIGRKGSSPHVYVTNYFQ